MATKTAKAHANIDTLRSIIEHHQHASLNFEDGPTVNVDAFTASAVLAVYDALNESNQAKFKAVLRTRAGFMRMVNFSWQHVS